MVDLRELRSLIVRHAASGGAPRRTGPGQATALAGVRLTCLTAPTDPAHHVYEPSFAVIAQGAKQKVLFEKVFDYHAGQYVVVSVDLPVASRIVEASEDAPYLAVAMTLEPTAIANLLLEAAAVERVAIEPSGMGISGLTTELLEPVVRLLRLLDCPRDRAVMRPMLEREILWRLLCGEQGAMVRQIGLVDSRLSKIGHAIRWIRTHYADTVRIETLADLAAMSVSSFHRHFRAVAAMSPLQYQKQIRLQAARKRLMAGSEDVAAVGFAVGYDSPSQFSREYSRLFGAPPGRDIHRLRRACLAAPLVEASQT